MHEYVRSEWTHRTHEDVGSEWTLKMHEDVRSKWTHRLHEVVRILKHAFVEKNCCEKLYNFTITRVILSP